MNGKSKAAPAYAILIPEGTEDEEQDRLCYECRTLPPAPDERATTEP
jgi:hypothetical protein